MSKAPMSVSRPMSNSRRKRCPVPATCAVRASFFSPTVPALPLRCRSNSPLASARSTRTRASSTGCRKGSAYRLIAFMAAVMSPRCWCASASTRSASGPNTWQVVQCASSTRPDGPAPRSSAIAKSGQRTCEQRSAFQYGGRAVQHRGIVIQPETDGCVSAVSNAARSSSGAMSLASIACRRPR